MKLFPLLAATTCIATTGYAEDTRELDAHEHGVGELNIAIEGQQVAMELHVPGADIVGFEYEATSAEDRAAIEAAVAKLNQPLSLFEMTDAAGCTVVKASAGLETEEDHEDHDHDDHDEHGDEDHADHKDDKDHADHDHEGHGDEDHADHEDEAGHTEFHAEYLLTCANPSALDAITFAYFDAFPNALEVEVQLVSDSGAQAFEVERDAPVLDLSDQL
ncbi:zinc uptake protein ZrgA [Algirhabdus cladophorae]|uniref:zinc uptake protein ZrgA n=1 Tax=Algirhabdus cladophorae TaxID=3377108 RepID=UPI003B84A53C